MALQFIFFIAIKIIYDDDFGDRFKSWHLLNMLIDVAFKLIFLNPRKLLSKVQYDFYY